jgi:hypothetical protein
MGSYRYKLKMSCKCSPPSILGAVLAFVDCVPVNHLRELLQLAVQLFQVLLNTARAAVLIIEK